MSQSPSSKVASLIKEGVEHFRNGRTDHAKVCWEVAQELEPDNLHVKKYLQLLDDEPPSPSSSSLGPANQAQKPKKREAPTLQEIPIVPEQPAKPPSNGGALGRKTPLPMQWRPLSGRPEAVRQPSGPHPQVPLRSRAPSGPNPQVSQGGRLPSGPIQHLPQEEPKQAHPDAQTSHEGVSDSTLWAVTGELELPLEGGDLGAPKPSEPDAPIPRGKVSPSSSSTHVAVTPEHLVPVGRTGERTPAMKSAGEARRVPTPPPPTDVPQSIPSLSAQEQPAPQAKALSAGFDSRARMTPPPRAPMPVRVERTAAESLAAPHAPFVLEEEPALPSFVEEESSTSPFVEEETNSSFVDGSFRAEGDSSPLPSSPLLTASSDTLTASQAMAVFGQEERVEGLTPSAAEAPEGAFEKTEKEEEEAAKTPGIEGESFAKALDAALAKEFSTLLGDDVQWPTPVADTPLALPDPTLPLHEFIRECLLSMLSATDAKTFDAYTKHITAREDIPDLLEDWPLPEEIVEGLETFFDKLQRRAVDLYVSGSYASAYRLFLLCFCARPEDARVRKNIDKLKKRLENH